MKSIKEIINESNKIIWCITWFKPEREYLIFYTFKSLFKSPQVFDDGVYKETVEFCKSMKKLKCYRSMDNCLSLPDNFNIDDKSEFINKANSICKNAEYSAEFEKYCETNL